jgi:tripeptidyl-peptidase-1
VSDPSHHRYGQHLSAEEVNELAKPDPKALKSVHNWLAQYGFTEDTLSHNAAKDWIKLAISVKDAENLLNTNYSIFKHEDGSELIRAPQWSLPKDLHQHVVTIQPTNSFLRATPKRFNHKPLKMHVDNSNIDLQVKVTMQDPVALAKAQLKEVCNVDSVTSSCLRKIYNTFDYVPSALSDPRNVIAFANYLNETSMDSDLQLFLKKYRSDAASAQVNFTIINSGANYQTLPSDNFKTAGLNQEGNLDGQTLIGMVHPMKVRAFNTGGSPPFIPDKGTETNTNEPYLEWLEYLLDKEKNIPYTITTSYGDDEQTVPRDYAIKTCQQMAMLGARGVSLLFASGDNGVGGDARCQSNDGKNTSLFIPSFPSSCPYVTTVGATKNYSPEIAAWSFDNHFASGGGFSNYFPRPSYQASAVTGYLSTLGDSLKGYYNTSGRAYPDVSAQGQSYAIFYLGNDNHPVDGTSASTPTMAAVIALLNDYRVANNKTSLGFINPWLYKEGYKGFNDIIEGSARGCEEIESTLGMGFPAAKGWDAVTGFGTPVRSYTLARSYFDLANSLKDFKKLQPLVLQKGGFDNPLPSK